MVQAVSALPLIDRKRCREVFERRFTVERMVKEYVGIYEQLAAPALRTKPHAHARPLSHLRVGLGRQLVPETDVA